MLDGKHDFVEFHDEQSASRDDSIHGLLAKLNALEKELGQFIRETFREGSCAAPARVGSLDSE